MAGGITLMAEESRHPEALPQVLKKPRGVKQGTLEIERWKPSAACRRCGSIGRRGRRCFPVFTGFWGLSLVPSRADG
ncbi:MAG: hypothetical protein R6V46_14145 [Desulfatiglandaceae bacterium]